MATAEEIAAKHTEFQAAVADLATAQAAYETSRADYLEKKQAYMDAIDAVDTVDNELEALTTGFEPPAHPAPQ